MPPVHTNRLAEETSPYLLQHAHNPVDWFAWGEEAWARARAEDKPVLVSVGYAACHWCHVMERESFEDEQIAALQNELVVSIKVDREERPDVDDIYMEAQQLIHGHGGWPLNVFCTPDGRPFFGGTYFPPQGRTGMPGWPDVLRGVSRAWREQREQVEKQADQLTQHLNLRVELAAEESSESAASIRRRAASQLLQNRDRQHGGFGGAPKFPQPAYLQLIRQQALDDDAPDAAEAREHLALTLRRMAEGGIYDQLAGGFHRYAVDQIWLVPHFEKMLYDNALLIPLYLDGWSMTGEDLFRRIAAETCEYMLDGLQTPEGAFYASTDADSEGVEGKFFVWTREELFDLLPSEDAEIACRYWGVDVSGNFEGKTILTAANEAEAVGRWLNVSEESARESLARSRETLLAARAERIPPATDTKVIAAWNGLAIEALARAGAVLDEPRFVAAAARAARRILSEMRDADGGLLRIFAGGRASVPAFLEDYAALANGCLSLYEATADETWFAEGRRLAEQTCARFWDDEHGAFFAVAHDGEALIARRKPTQDGATPSGNALAAKMLARLYALTAEGQWADRVEAMRGAFSAFLERAPTMLGDFVAALDWLESHRSVALIGDPEEAELRAMRRLVQRDAAQPTALMERRAEAETVVPQLADKPGAEGRATAYVCRGFACSAPVHSAAELAALLADPVSRVEA